MLCPICNTKAQMLYPISRFEPAFNILRCSDCGLQMQENVPDKLESLYTKKYYSGEAKYSYQDERSS